MLVVTKKLSLFFFFSLNIVLKYPYFFKIKNFNYLLDHYLFDQNLIQHSHVIANLLLHLVILNVNMFYEKAVYEINFEPKSSRSGSKKEYAYWHLVFYIKSLFSYYPKIPIFCCITLINLFSFSFWRHKSCFTFKRVGNLTIK